MPKYFWKPSKKWMLGILAASVWAATLPSGSVEEIPREGGTDVAGRRYPLLSIDESRLLNSGLHRIVSERLTLYTDLPLSPEIEELGRVFDAAYPQWCAFCGITPGVKPWRMRGFLMGDARRFRELGVLPPWLPPFANGFSVGDILWIYEQPTAYYRRHLLIHEGTHGFLRAHRGEFIPPWYNEGIAELLGTHFWDGQAITLAHIPRSRLEVPMWGRIKIVRDAVAARRPISLADILNFGPTAHREVEPYGWCWAATALFDRDPRFQTAFRQLSRLIGDRHFNEKFLELLGPDWRTAQYQWLIVLADLEYGYDFVRTAADFTPGLSVLPGGSLVRIEAARGWQNSRLQVEAGKRYELSASGRFIVAQEGGPWECEPQGVTIRYIGGRPLGIVEAAVMPLPDNPPHPAVEVITPANFFQPVVVGRQCTLQPPRTGTLFLRINDSPAELHDNSGDVVVKIVPVD